MIRKRLLQMKALAADVLAYMRHRHGSEPDLSGRILYVEFENPNLYHRFFYLMLKMFHLAGYKIIYPMDFSKFRNLRNGDPYLALILKEKDFLSLQKIPKQHHFTAISDKDFSADYFKTYFEEGNRNHKAFHIPMTFHPLMYHKNLWSKCVGTDKKRINSLFCYGNFDDKAYLDIDRTAFQVINRRKLYEHFQRLEQYYLIKNQEDLDNIICNKPMRKYIFAEKYVYPLPMEQVRATLSEFRYFLCCPGVVMPLCHNVIEAMSVGTVPVIQQEYADVMYPNLKNGVDALIFQNLEDLDQILNHKLFDITDSEFEKMSGNCLKYYQKNLSPQGVSEGIERHIGKSKIYLNAEHRSIKYIQ